MQLQLPASDQMNGFGQGRTRQATMAFHDIRVLDWPRLSIRFEIFDLWLTQVRS